MGLLALFRNLIDMTVMLQSQRGAGETVLVLHTASSAADTAAYGVTIGTHTITGERG